MKKIFILVLFLIALFNSNKVYSNFFDDEQVEIILINKTEKIMGNKTTEDTSGSMVLQKGRSIYLFGAGFRYFTMKNLYFEFSSLSLLNQKHIGLFDISGSSPNELRVVDFKETTLSLNYNYIIRNKINIIGGVCGNYIKSYMVNDFPVNIPNWWSECFIWNFKTGMLYQLTKKLKFGVDIGYLLNNKIKYSNTQSNPKKEVNIEISPISFDLSLSFQL